MTDNAIEFAALRPKEAAASRSLETFPAPPYVESVKFVSDELTTLCPITGQPDFNTITIEYAPRSSCIESKSLKLYLWSYRNEGLFGEALAAQIAQDVHEATGAPVIVTLEQHVRGGIAMTVKAEA